jgi:hypothetical protein
MTMGVNLVDRFQGSIVRHMILQRGAFGLTLASDTILFF